MTTPICQEWMKNRPIELEYSTTVFFTFKVLKQEMDFKQTTAHVHDTGGVFAKKSCKGHVIPAQFSPNHGPCNRCVTLVVSLLKPSCKGHVISAFCKPWPNVHGSSSVVFAKTIMQRPRDTRRLFSKAWQWTW